MCQDYPVEFLAAPLSWDRAERLGYPTNWQAQDLEPHMLVLTSSALGLLIACWRASSGFKADVKKQLKWSLTYAHKLSLSKPWGLPHLVTCVLPLRLSVKLIFNWFHLDSHWWGSQMMNDPLLHHCYSFHDSLYFWVVNQCYVDCIDNGVWVWILTLAIISGGPDELLISLNPSFPSYEMKIMITVIPASQN